MFERWLQNHTHSLQGKRVAVAGATGGLGEPLCRYLAGLGAELILLCRNEEKARNLLSRLQGEYPHLRGEFIPLDLEDMTSVDAAADRLVQNPPHILIHNAGAYAVPRYHTTHGVDNVFQINCLAPYRLTCRLWQAMSAVGGHVVVVGSVAHNYSRIDPADPDFSTRSAASKAYGNAKRHLMLAMYERFREEESLTLSVAHPGITFTNITAHYPPWLFAIIKHPMKIIFMPAKKAALCLVEGCFTPCAYGEWIGPRLFDVWGLPRKRALRTFTLEEAQQAFEAVEKYL